MTEFDIAAIRMYNQQLVISEFKSAKALVSHFGAMQAQDYPMSKWAIGARLPGITDESVEYALDNAEILRTHVLRPTWHLVAFEDIRWLLELTGGNILRQMGSMNKKLGLDDRTFAKTTDIIVKSLENQQHLTRGELVEILNYHGVQTNEYRSLQILAHAELHGTICSGKRKGKHHSYALLELGKRYFTSHGPATQKDFHWWSGLSVSESQLAIELNRKKLLSTLVDGQTYYYKDADYPEVKSSVLLLPAFDEYLIAYKDRTASIQIRHMRHAFTVNGIFKPVVVVDGQVVGIWKRAVRKDKMIVELNFLQKISKQTETKVVDAAQLFGAFADMDVEIKINHTI